MAKKFVYIKLKSTFTEELQGTYNKSIVFIEDTNEIFTHGVFFGIPTNYKDKVDSLESAMAALKCFASVSDGTNTAQALNNTGVLKFTASNGMTVVVGTQGVTLKGTTIAESATNGNITVKGPSGNTEVKVHGLNSAAYQPISAFATPTSVSAVDEKADAAQDAAQAAQAAATAAQGNINAHIDAKNNPHAVTKAHVGLAKVENKTVAEILTNAALTGTPTAPTPTSNDDSTKIATTEFVKDAVAAGVVGVTNALVFKGTLGTNGTVTALPETPKVGDVYIVSTAATYGGNVCEVGDMLICTKAKAGEGSAEWKAVQANINGAITGGVTMTADQLVVGAGGKAVKVLAAGSANQILKIVSGKPAWATEYKVAVQAGTDGALTIDGQKYTVGKPATAGTADKVAQKLTISLNGTAQTGFDGSAAVSFNITPSSIGAAAASHTHVGTAVTLTGYSKPASYSAIAATDNVNAAIGKLEAGLNELDWEEL